MKLFLDTEFTDLAPGAKLISIALVTENGEFFYAELTDTYKLKQCSNFTKIHVIPHLRGRAYHMTTYECSLQLGNWIEEQGPSVIVSDNPDWDMPYLEDLLSAFRPQNLHRCPHRIWIEDSIVAKIVSDNNFSVHNALDDARIMMLADKINEAREY